MHHSPPAGGPALIEPRKQGARLADRLAGDEPTAVTGPGLEPALLSLWLEAELLCRMNQVNDRRGTGGLSARKGYETLWAGMEIQRSQILQIIEGGVCMV